MKLPSVLAGFIVAAAGCAGDPTAPFVGTWNYDQPDRASGLNISTITCPSPGPTLVVPQIGNIVISKAGDNALVGVTDQGCSWSFTVHDKSATLDPPMQTCFNNIIGSSYTLDWTLSVSGDGETEVIHGPSHMAFGDCQFALPNAKRTRVTATSGDATAAFVGIWEYDAPDPATGVNIASVSCGPEQSYAPVVGKLVVARSGDQEITASSDDGCVWRYAVAGNTAELAPLNQECTAKDGTRSTLIQSALAVGAKSAFEYGGGFIHKPAGDCRQLAAIGSLTRR